MVLRHIAEPAPQIFHIIVPDGMSAVHDIIRIHCIELTEKEPDEGAFAGTGTSYDAERHTFFNSEIDIPQSRRFVIREVEGTDIECYITLWIISSPVIPTDIIPCPHDFLNPVVWRLSPLHKVEEPAQCQKRPDHHAEICCECHQLPDGNCFIYNHPGTKQD